MAYKAHEIKQQTKQILKISLNIINCNMLQHGQQQIGAKKSLTMWQF